MASFISAILLNGGYSEKDIKLNSFDIEEGVPMMDTSGENIFDGGEDSQSSQNIEVIKEGQSKKTIIVGAHYDSAGTHGVDDNGSGVAVTARWHWQYCHRLSACCLWGFRQTGASGFTVH